MSRASHSVSARGVNFVRVEYIEQAQVTQAFSPDRLFMPGFCPEHYERSFSKGAHLADGTVATHRNNQVSTAY